MGATFTIDGVCEGRPARLLVTLEQVELTRVGEEPRSVPLAEGVSVSLVERGPTGVFATAGVFLVALAALWALDGAVAWPVCGATGTAGAVLILLGLALRVALVQVVTPSGALVFLCRGGRARATAREAVQALREAKPGSARKPSATVVQFMLGELGALFAGEARLRHEYRLIAGEKAEAQMEARFLGARRKIALWNLLWTFLVPLAGAAIAGLVFARWGTSHAAIAALLAFIVLVFVGLKALPRLQPVLAQLLS